MPELPEVQTTAEMLRRLLPGLKITDVWSGYDSAFHKGKPNIKNLRYFEKEFRPRAIGAKIADVSRRGKNVLIWLSNGNTVVVHMKMTGHLLFGTYRRISKHRTPSSPPALKQLRLAGKQIPISRFHVAEWEAAEKGPLQDPYSRFIRLVFALNNGKHLALSDARRFAKVSVVLREELFSRELAHLGPEPLERKFTFTRFSARLDRRPDGKIKQVLMNQEIVAGIGNIYSDEMLWLSGIHPLRRVRDVSPRERAALFRAMKSVFKKGIALGGDSMSDYRSPDGRRGTFQTRHAVYRRRGKKCRRCGGITERIIVGGRSAHFCPRHQK